MKVRVRDVESIRESGYALLIGRVFDVKDEGEHTLYRYVEESDVRFPYLFKESEVEVLQAGVVITTYRSDEVVNAVTYEQGSKALLDEMEFIGKHAHGLAPEERIEVKYVVD